MSGVFGMGKFEFINQNKNEVHLLGPDKVVESFTHGEKKILSDYFTKYVPRYLRVIRPINSESAVIQKAQPPQPPPPQPPQRPQPRQIQVKRDMRTPLNVRMPIRPTVKIKQNVRLRVARHVGQNKTSARVVVGRTKLILSDAEKYYREYLSQANHSISNDIGIGILSYNRLESLNRLLDSIRKNTDLKRTTIFISDESSDDEVKRYISNIPDMIVINNKDRLGVAGNTNRLMRCLDRFRYRIILNDDVEVLQSGWDKFYFDAIEGTKCHHFCMRQAGLLGAVRGEKRLIGGHNIYTVNEKPHGAVFVYDHVAATKVGYMDEDFGVYGMEHVDWSNRVSMSGIQPPGFHDLDGSEKFFRIHDDKSSVVGRIEMLINAKKKFIDKSSNHGRIFVNCSPKTILPAVSYIIPFKDANVLRKDSILTVIQNVKSQKFPIIDIILAEQDDVKRVLFDQFVTVNHVLAPSEGNHPFTKSVAFNVGFKHAKADKIILHDADMIVRDEYTKIMYSLLCKHSGAHIGSNVLYLDRPSTENIVTNLRVNPGYGIERSVGYFEGGSLGCTSKTYVDIGGFIDDFVGYGCFCPGGDNFVLTDSGYKRIEFVTKDDMVYTHEGRFRNIELRTRNYVGDVLDIFVPGRLPIKGVTPEHPFLIEDDDKFRWCKACNLQNGDNILDTDFIPEMVKPYDFNDIVKFDKTKNKFNIFNNMNEFCYLLGLYIAEGVLQTPDRLRMIYYYLHKDEMFLVKHITEIVQLLNDDINVTYHYVKNNCREIRVFNSLLTKLIFAIAGKHNATEKIISSKFLNQLNFENVGFLLGGMFDGDANHSNGSQNRLIYHTSSINLAMIVSGQLRRLGIAHSFGKRKGGSFEGSSEYSYDLCVNREFEHKIQLVYKTPPVIGSSSFGRSKFGTIFKIKRRNYSGPVFNFEVENDHSYIVNGMVVHNCEDCEFFSRLAAYPGFFNDRSENLIHLYHDRSGNWNVYHQKNKLLEAKLYAQNMNNRLNDSRARFSRKYGVDISNRWT